MKSSLYVPKNTCKSSLLSLITAEIESIDYSSFVNLTTNQTIGGSKTFLSDISITNGAFISTALGSAAAVAFSVGGVGTGMFSGAANQLNLSTSGTSRLLITTSSIQTALQLRLQSGTAANPGLAFTSDTSNDSGLYLIGADNIGFSAGGTLRWDYNTSRINSAIPIILPSGSSAAPAVGVGSSDTGIYSASAGGFLNFAINGINRLEISSARIDTSLPVWIPNGSAAAPSLSFSNDAGNNTGIYFIGADNVGFTAGGTLRWDYSTSRIRSDIPVRISNGTAAIPALAFSTSDTDTGFYSPGDGAIELSTNAVRTARFDTGAQFLYGINGGGVERFLFNSDTTSGDVFRVYQTRGSTAAYFFYSNAGTYGTVSDRKLKKNIQDLQISKASQLVKLILPKKYEWEETDDNSIVSGFIAQDLKEAVQEVGEFERLISEDGNGTLRVAHDQMLVVLAAALKDVLDRLEKIEKKSS